MQEKYGDDPKAAVKYFGIATAICAICPLAIAGAFTGVYWRMYQVSMEL